MKCDDLEEVVIYDNLKKFFRVGAQLPLQEKEELIEFLKRNINIFASDACDTPGIDPAFICHHLNVNSPSLLRSSHPIAHQESTLMRLGTKWRSLSVQGLSKRFFTPNSWPTPWWSRRKVENDGFV